MTNTGVFATAEERVDCLKAAQEASNTPMITTGVGKTDFATLAWRRTWKLCHSYALAHGLPEIEGYYGMTEGGEFVL